MCISFSYVCTMHRKIGKYNDIENTKGPECIRKYIFILNRETRNLCEEKNKKLFVGLQRNMNE